MIKSSTMITEQTKVTVEFTIHELLHIYDQLVIARDHGADVQLCDYLCDRLNTEIPDFAESKDYYKPLKRYYDEDCSDDKGIYTY